MFTLQQIKAAHAKVKSGADFPAYVQTIKQLGLLKYTFRVKNGQTVYQGADNFQLSTDRIYAEKTIAKATTAAAVRQLTAEHQQGRSDFLTFCQQVAAAGIEKWVVDTQAMACTYHDLTGACLVAEPIPDTGY